MSALEIEKCLVSDLLPIIADTELCRPGADLPYSLFKFLDVAHVHLGDMAMHINDSARFIVVVVRLTKD